MRSFPLSTDCWQVFGSGFSTRILGKKKRKCSKNYLLEEILETMTEGRKKKEKKGNNFLLKIIVKIFITEGSGSGLPIVSRTECILLVGQTIYCQKDGLYIVSRTYSTLLVGRAYIFSRTDSILLVGRTLYC